MSMSPTGAPATIRLATEDDAASLAALGIYVFTATYGSMMPASDLCIYLGETYTSEAMRQNLRDPKQTILVAFLEPDQHDRSSSSSLPSMPEFAANVSSTMTNALEMSSPPIAKPAGFLILQRGTSDSCLSSLQAARIEIQRLYVDPLFHGRGIAGALMSACESIARDEGCGATWLGVNNSNLRAVRFYQKCGFETAGERNFVTGTRVWTDWVMVKHLE